MLLLALPSRSRTPLMIRTFFLQGPFLTQCFFRPRKQLGSLPTLAITWLLLANNDMGVLDLSIYCCCTLQKVNSFKFGVLYATEKQDETAMYNNRKRCWRNVGIKCLAHSSCNLLWTTEEGSEGFEAFLEMLGEKVQLSGWTKYSAGLDTSRTILSLYSLGSLFWSHVNSSAMTRSRKLCLHHLPRI